MIVVSNASPIINLSAIGKLELLKSLYGSVLIPDAVFREVDSASPGDPAAEQVKTSEWIQTGQVSNRSLVSALKGELDEGEAEAIALAVEKEADLLLMDERLGRKVASRMGIRFIGLLGILIDAKRKVLIPAVRPLLDDLVTRAGFWISSELYRRVIEAAGE